MVTTFAVCVAGAIIPVINTEIYLLSAVALSPPAYAPPLVVMATLGQMTGKVAMFYGGKGVLRVRHDRVRNGVARLRAMLEHRPWTSRAVLFSSATVGLPPLYVMSVACGTIGMSIVTFFVIGTAGRLIHFAAVAFLPRFVRGLAG
jgi:membrane protein YqaA with SNARE-associated domain